MPIRKLVRISMIVDHTAVFDILSAATGKAVGAPAVVPVVHSGEDASGKLLPAHQDTREFVNAYMARHASFSTREIVPAGVQAGFTKNAVYACLSTFVSEGKLKRGEAGEYAVKAALTRAKKGERKTTNPKPGQSQPERIVALVAKKQNGTGEGVSLGFLKAAMAKKGYQPSGVGPALTTLVNDKKLVRVAPGQYRTAG